MMNYSCEPNDMKYGQMASNKHINELIYRCFEYIGEEDEQRFVKEFREQPRDSDQIMHTLRELVLGAYLGSSCFKVRHDCAVDTQTPDWCILDEKSVVTGIVELTNFHIDKATEDEIEAQMKARGVTGVWRDENKDNVDRLYHCIWHKAQVYRILVEKLRVPYVVAVFGEFRAAIDFEEEVCPCLFDDEFGLFEMYPEVSGVLYFEESSGRYSFSYAHNPNALRRVDLPSGVFPPGATD
jgi:hypothetical protein